MKTSDVIIIGAGPAGTICGHQLRKAGVDCVIADYATFPRAKLCGGGLTHKAYELLEKIMPELEYDYQPMKKIRLLYGHEKRCEFEPKYELRIVDRKDFDNRLLQVYRQKGGVVIQDTFDHYELQSDGKILVTFRSGEQWLCNYLVGADGANSRVRHQAIGDYSEKVLCLEQFEQKHSDALVLSISEEYPMGYCYLFPALHHDVVGYGDAKTNKDRFRKILKSYGHEATKVYGAQIPVKHVDSGLEHVILIGDAGGYPNKLTYEGIYYAMATACHASTAIVEGIPFSRVNRPLVRKKQKEAIMQSLFFTKFGMWLYRFVTAKPSRVKWIFDREV